MGAASGEAARRWRRLVRGRRAELERLSPTQGGKRAWNARARRCAESCALHKAAGDPFVSRVGRVLGRRSTVLDVGSGPGRFALPLAGRAEAVTAVDPSSAMLRVIRAEARRRGIGNVSTVLGRWQDVDVVSHDVVVCAFVLPLIEDAVPFVAKLDSSARRRVFLYLGTFAADVALEPLWRHFHGSPRRPGPSWVDARAVLQEMGIDPKVEAVEVPSHTRFANLAEAIDDYRRALLLPSGRQVRRELEGLLAGWLVAADGGLRPPVRSVPSVILSWEPGARAAP